MIIFIIIIVMPLILSIYLLYCYFLNNEKTIKDKFLGMLLVIAVGVICFFIGQAASIEINENIEIKNIPIETADNHNYSVDYSVDSNESDESYVEEEEYSGDYQEDDWSGESPYRDSESGYHVTSGYEREDGTYVSGYVAGNPDGVEENNINYMEEHGDKSGLEAAYESINDW